jgi:hypothetical protein
MFAIFGKKKVKENVVANIFVNTILNTIDSGFIDVVGVINDAPEFTTSPNLTINNDDAFVLIILAANLNYIPANLKNQQDERLKQLIITKFSNAFGVEEEQLKEVIGNYQCYLAKVNHPSKNTRYAMSKAIFGKYHLNQFQDEYFQNMNSPNPMFLKRLDEVLESFLWNWDTYTDKFHIV